MDMRQETTTADDDGKPVMTYVAKQFFDQFAQQGFQADDNNELPIELSRFELMNDDCLLAIFSVKSLTPMDLCSIAETCPRFKEIAQLVFPKKFISGYDYETRRFNSKWGFGESVLDVERVLNHFGSSISEYRMDVCVNDSLLVVLELVTKYCADSLERLKISSMKIPEAVSVKLKPIFQRLLVLNIAYAQIDGGKQLFANCDSLIELRISGVHAERTLNAILENVFPKLERFKIDLDSDFEILIDESALFNFIQRHKSLKTLNVDIDMKESTELNTIVFNMKELKELRWPHHASNFNLTELQSSDQLRLLEINRPSTENILQLQAMKALETLKIRDALDDLQLFPALSRLTNLRELYLHRFRGPVDSNQIILLTQLTKLHMLPYGDVPNVVDIIRRLTNLEELTIRTIRSLRWNPHFFELTKKQFREIIKIVAGRSNVLTLECSISFSFNHLKFCSQHCDENVKVTLIN